MANKKILATISAILAAIFYAINMPFSKLLLDKIEPTFMASFLYLGAGIGIGIVYLFVKKRADKSEKLTKNDLPYTLGMIVLDIAAPICLMYGLTDATAGNASLLNNFEIVATSIIALIIFKEVISSRLWVAIAFITISSIILSFEGLESFKFSYGSIFVLLATVFWGLENNCTRKISSKNTYEIVILKGIFSGLGCFIIALFVKESIPQLKYAILALVLGFIAYGLSIFFYIRAQKELGAAKTSAYYAIAPFVGAFLSFAILHEQLNLNYIIALIFMIIGSIIVSVDILIIRHSHLHSHTFIHTHDNYTHSHILEHSHKHTHCVVSGQDHKHKIEELSATHKMMH